MVNNKIAIVCLLRYYDTFSGYTEIISRNHSIIKYIGTDIPILIFNEGTISPQCEEYISKSTPELKISFIDIKKDWNFKYPYASMCRFFSYHIWNYCKDYEYIMRIDTDCEIIESQNIFCNLYDNNVYYNTVFWPWGENHEMTNSTLPKFIESITDVDKNIFYNKFPYTNVYLSKVNFWLDYNINNILKKICLSDFQLTNRWGDLPILGSMLNIFAKDDIGTLQIKYKHKSHNCIVDCINQQLIFSDNTKLVC